jgi:hypothetical protein
MFPRRARRKGAKAPSGFEEGIGVLRILRLSDRRFGDLMNAVQPTHRYVMSGFPAVNLYLPEFQVLVIRKDDLEVRTSDDAAAETISLSKAVQLAWSKEV